MPKNNPSFTPGLLVLLILSLCLAACGKIFVSATPIGILSGLPSETTAAVHPGIALEQQNGYTLGLKSTKVSFNALKLNEGAAQDEIQRSIRDMAENSGAPMMALLGGTSNDETSNAAALVNFFTLPMLVPSADGDSLFPATNLWAFRLSASSTSYANFLFGSVLTKPFLDPIYTGANGANIQPLSVAILYEENTFGESAAVATATAAMAQSIKVAVYGNFKTDNPDPTGLRTLITNVKNDGVQVVYLVASDTPMAKTLVQTFQAVYAGSPLPILVGQAGGFASLEFLAAPEAEGVYVLRQKIDPTSCPPGIKSMYDAQTYASVYLLDQAVQQSKTSLAAIPTQFSLTGPSGPTLLQQREAIRDALKNINMNVPCLGPVAFDTAGQNRLVQLEFVTVKNGQTLISTPVDFENTVKTALENGIPQ